MVATFGYWKLRGLGQPIRLLLEYTGTDYKEKFYEFGPAPAYNVAQWEAEKFNLGMELPNLPYYFDGNLKITQSNAIMRYIARKNNMCGSTEEEIVRADMLENQAMDIKMEWIKTVYNDQFETLKGAYVSESIPKNFGILSKVLGKHKWFAGEKLTYVDFLIYEAIDVNLILAPNSLKDFSNLQSFMTRFESLAPIKAYMNSSRFLKGPLNGPRAHFGGH